MSFEVTSTHSLLVRSEDALAVVEQMPSGVLILGDGLRILGGNPAAARLLGRPGDILLGRDWPELWLDPARARSELERLSGLPDPRPKFLLQPKLCSDPLEVALRNHPRTARPELIFLSRRPAAAPRIARPLPTASERPLIARSPAMQPVLELIDQVADLETTVLIEGETGTGKELVAHAIHDRGRRQAAPFVPLNCAALTESLLASQLFGHQRGAFTGAFTAQSGVFESASGGTVFLDEIGDIPPSVQCSLLRVLQEREITRLGETMPRSVDVRIVAATHRDLAKEVVAGRFREDLYYRLHVVRIPIPPLRDRLEDLPLLVRSFVHELKDMSGSRIESVSEEAMCRLMLHRWPGNVRELRAAIEYALIRGRSDILQAEDLPSEVARHPGSPLPANEEEIRIRRALERTGGNRAAAARQLSISRATLYRRLAKLGL